MTMGLGNIGWQRCCQWWLCNILFTALIHGEATKAFLFYPRGGSLGYLAAVAMPLELPQRNVYVAFNFEANYGTPPNSTYLEWAERWNIAKNKFGIGNNVTGIDGRQRQQRRSVRGQYGYTRFAFYRSFVGYANEFGLNGRACLLRTICEVAASNLDEHNGLLGSIFKILFMPSTSAPELNMEIFVEANGSSGTAYPGILYEAEAQGRTANCTQFFEHCPEGILNMISKWI